MPEEQQSPEPGTEGSVLDESSAVGPPREEPLTEEPPGVLQGEKPSADAGTAGRELPPEPPDSAQTDESETTTPK